MITIYHNPRCRKSREGLQILEQSGKPFKVVEYLKQPLNVAELSTLIETLHIAPIELVRKNESIWKEQFKGKTMTDAQIIAAMEAFPKLIERPIVTTPGKAVIGRPPENILAIL